MWWAEGSWGVIPPAEWSSTTSSEPQDRHFHWNRTRSTIKAVARQKQGCRSKPNTYCQASLPHLPFFLIPHQWTRLCKFCLCEIGQTIASNSSCLGAQQLPVQLPGKKSSGQNMQKKCKKKSGVLQIFQCAKKCKLWTKMQISRFWLSKKKYNLCNLPIPPLLSYENKKKNEDKGEQQQQIQQYYNCNSKFKIDKMTLFMCMML